MSSFNVVRDFRSRLSASEDAPLRVHAPLALGIGGALCVAGVMLLGPMVSRSAAEDAGIFSFLFGESRPARSSFSYATSGWNIFDRETAPRYYVPRAPSRFAKIAQRRKKNAGYARVRFLDDGKLGRTVPIVMVPKNLSPLEDHTLRRGDAVMTAHGVRIFRGSRHYPFAVSDFRPLAVAGKVAHRSALLEIDKAVQPAVWSASFGAPAPVATILRAAVPGPTAIRVVETLRRS